VLVFNAACFYRWQILRKVLLQIANTEGGAWQHAKAKGNVSSSHKALAERKTIAAY